MLGDIWEVFLDKINLENFILNLNIIFQQVEYEQDNLDN